MEINFMPQFNNDRDKSFEPFQLIVGLDQIKQPTQGGPIGQLLVQSLGEPVKIIKTDSDLFETCLMSEIEE